VHEIIQELVKHNEDYCIAFDPDRPAVKGKDLDALIFIFRPFDQMALEPLFFFAVAAMCLKHW